MDQLIKKYLLSLQYERGLSSKTIEAYSNDLHKYSDYLVTQIYFPRPLIKDSRKEASFWVSTNDSSFIEDYGDTRNTVKVYNYKLKNNLDYSNLSKNLYQYLISPIESKLKYYYQNLVFMPDNNFSLLPFETLIDEEGKYLIEKVNISYAQSLNTYAMIDESSKGKLKPTLLAFSDPDYSYQDRTPSKNTNSYTNQYIDLGYKDWPSLPGTRKELDNIKKFVPNSDIYYGVDATESKIKELQYTDKIKDYDIIHFASHGILVPEFPELNAIVLSQNDTSKEDGYLTTNEIEALDLNAKLVVLSACETASGESFYSEGIVGLTNSFFIAGAKGVISTLWPIDDAATSTFMTRLYSNIYSGSRISIALNDTKREFINGDHGEEYKKPYYWAPFIYYGK